MSRKALVFTLLAWSGVWAFWLFATRDSHPSFTLSLIVTTSLMVAYALAAHLNHLWLIPRYWVTGRRGMYSCCLSGSMLLLNGAALTVIRVSYFQLWGPDADPNGTSKHFAIDLFGMVVHLLLAVLVVRGWRRFHPTEPNR